MSKLTTSSSAASSPGNHPTNCYIAGVHEASTAAKPVAAQLIERDRFHALTSASTLGDDPVRRRQQLWHAAAQTSGYELLPAPLEVEALERELDRVRLHLQLVTKERAEAIERETSVVRRELSDELEVVRAAKTEAERALSDQRSDFQEQLIACRRETALLKQELSATEVKIREADLLKEELSKLEDSYRLVLDDEETHLKAMEEQGKQMTLIEEENGELRRAIKQLESELTEKSSSATDHHCTHHRRRKGDGTSDSSEVGKSDKLKEKFHQQESVIRALEKQVATGHKALAEAERRYREKLEAVETKAAKQVTEVNAVLRTVEQNLKMTREQLKDALSENAELTHALNRVRNAQRVS